MSEYTEEPFLLDNPFRSKFSEYDEEAFLLANFSNQPKGFFVEIGANNGWKGSNVHALALNGWSGLCVEADPNTYPYLVETYLARPDITCVNAAVTDTDGTVVLYCLKEWCSGLSSTNVGYKDSPNVEEKVVRSVTLDTLLNENNVQIIDVLSIDAEGCDLDILKAFSFRLKPSVIIVEHSTLTGPNETDLHPFSYLLTPKGYRLIHKNKGNSIYKLSSLFYPV